MTTIRQLIQTSPVRANELFAKLVDTSDTAVKTRDRLFSELKVELDLQAELEEQHLFPVLKKHNETKGLVADALNDNRQTRKLLAELERTPKDSEAFGAKVAGLKKVFQQHIRDDKKEFLPAVVKALSDEEASTVVEKIEDEKAQIEAAQRAEADERRAEAKREREQAVAANAANGKAKADAERAQKDTDAAQAKASTVARKRDDEKAQIEAAQRAEADEREVEKLTRATRATAKAGADVARESVHVAQNTADAAEELIETTRQLAKESPEFGRAISELLSEQARQNVDTFSAFARAVNWTEVAQAQSKLIAGSFLRFSQFNARYGEILLRGMTATAMSPRR